jgi:epoxyqueuosine reductase
MGNRVFGCDICQEVCPFNERRAVPTEEAAFQPREVTREPLAELAGMTEQEFREQLKGSPVKRTKWRGLLRNVTAALSISDNPAAEAALVSALSHSEELVREQAIISLMVIRRRRAVT